MRIEYDPAKRAKTLAERGLDFRDAAVVMQTALKGTVGSRFTYGETRLNTFGLLRGRMVHVSCTLRDDAVRVISMRYANEREGAVLRGGVD